VKEVRVGELSTVLEGYSFLEGPRWREGRLWVSDFYTHRVVSTDLRGDVRVEAEVPGQPSGLGWLPDGRLLVVSMRDHRVLRREPDGELVEHADLSAYTGGHSNDMVVDAAGRAYVGDFGFDLMSGAPVRMTSLIRVEPDGTTAVAAEDMRFPNGALALDGVLLVAETLGARISAFDIAGDGSLSGRRDWARFGDAPDTEDVGETIAALAVAPDGISGPDAEGAIWVADALGNRVLRVREGGEIAEEISTGEVGVYACVLGGENGRTLFLCTAPGFAEHERRDTREARLLAVDVAVPAVG
jgi:sugar lactone lactonase YvrE